MLSELCLRPENVREFRSTEATCSYEAVERIFDEKNNRVEFLLIYYTGHTEENRQVEECLKKVSVRRLLCIIDCCRAHEVQLIPDKEDCSRVVLRSSEGTAKASSTAGSKFTRYYLAGLRSAVKCPCPNGIQCRLLKEFRENSRASGFVTLANLFDYASQHMETQKPRKDVVSYNNSDYVLAFFNKDPIVYNLQLDLECPNQHLPDVEIEEQMIDFNASFEDIYEQLRQEILNQGLHVHIQTYICMA